MSVWLFIFPNSYSNTGMLIFFKNSLQYCWLLTRYVPQSRQQGAQILVGVTSWGGVGDWRVGGGFRYSSVRTAKPLWLLHNPLQHIMCIMAAQRAFVTSRGGGAAAAAGAAKSVFPCVLLSLIWPLLYSVFPLYYVVFSLFTPPPTPSITPPRVSRPPSPLSDGRGEDGAEVERRSAGGLSLSGERGWICTLSRRPGVVPTCPRLNGTAALCRSTSRFQANAPRRLSCPFCSR